MNPLLANGVTYRGDLDWLPERVIYLVRGGSHAYGMATPESDLDLRGIAVPPAAYLLGYSARFEQLELKGDPDVVVFALAKFLRLAADCNPNTLESLFVDPEDVLYVHPAFQRLLDIRDRLLSLRASYRFRGYAVSQLKRIRRHRAWLLDPPKQPPSRADFGLPERTLIPKDQLQAAFAAVDKQLDEWELNLTGLTPSERGELRERMARAFGEIVLLRDEKFIPAARAIGLSENFIELMDKERAYRSGRAHWRQYQGWKRNRNEKRAEWERRYGYDVKHGAHLVRLLRMCREILTEGRVVVRRPDAEELMAIRRGELSYDELVAWAEQQDRELQALEPSSPLPPAPDVAAIEEACVAIQADVNGLASAREPTRNMARGRIHVWPPAAGAGSLRPPQKAKSLLSSAGAHCRQPAAARPSRHIPDRLSGDLRGQPARASRPAPEAGHRGVTLWLTGLSGSGKTTVARLVARLLRERGRTVVVLDGDELRKGLSRDLGFSPRDRAENIRRVGELAALLTGARLVVISAFISPYAAGRQAARARVQSAGDFVEVHVAAPLSVCEARDPKGLYRRARAGDLPDFTGIGAPYEPPEAPELVLRTERETPLQSALAIVHHLEVRGTILTSP